MNYTDIDNAQWTLTTPFPAPVEPIRKPRHEKPIDFGSLTKDFNQGTFRTDYTLHKALYRIGNGATWTSALLTQKKDEGFVSAKYIAVDFEENVNKGIKPPSLQAELDRADENSIPPLFYYYTFSHTEAKPRFRFVWELSELITDRNQYKAILTYMIRLFQGDGSCKDASRFWAGGHSLMIAETPFVSPTATFIERSQEFLESPLVYKEPSGKSPKTSTIDAPRKKLKIDYRILSSRCELWRKVIDFRDEEAYWASYGEIAHLALSAFSFEGGEKRIRDAIRENPQYYNNDKHDIKYYLHAISDLKRQQHEERCSFETCPFYDRCGHIGFISDKATVKKKTRYSYETSNHITLNEGQRRLQAAFVKAMENPSTGICFIKASVGIGKTQILQDYNFSGHRVIIAIPTHDLMNEYRKRFANSDFRVVFQEKIEYSDEDTKQMNRYRTAGLPYKAQSINNADNHRIFTKDYDIAIMTQAFFMEHNDVLIPYYDTFILDEDIKNRFYQTEQIQLSDLKRDIFEFYEKDIISDTDMPAIKKWLFSIEGKRQNARIEAFPPATIDASAMIEKGVIPCFNIWELMKEESTIVKGEVVKTANIAYTIKHEVPPIKMIVLSATIDERAHKHLFGEHVISFEEIPPIKLMGNVEFDVGETYSSSNIGNKSVKSIMKGLEGRYPDFFADKFIVIPHKRYVPEVKKLGYDYREGFHLGNTEGKDELNGENILVLGKYSQPMNAVISLALSAFPREYDISNKYCTMRRAGFEMSYFSFADDVLDALYLYLIDSETVQCIGRARLIWNECKVLVAGLPVEV